MSHRLYSDFTPREIPTFDDEDRRAYLVQPLANAGDPERRPEPPHCRRCDDAHRELYRSRFPIER